MTRPAPRLGAGFFFQGFEQLNEQRQCLSELDFDAGLHWFHNL